MTLKAKVKGTHFETELVKQLNIDLPNGRFKRVPGSGALGTSLNEPILTGDINGTVEGFVKPLKIECKVGYGGEKQFTLKREWLTKINQEAKASWGFPMLFGKFSGARKVDGVQEFIVLDYDNFIYLMKFITDLAKELGELTDEFHKIKEELVDKKKV